MCDHPGADAMFAAPQDDGRSIPICQSHFDESVASAALERWVLSFGEQQGCATVPAQRSEMSCAG